MKMNNRLHGNKKGFALAIVLLLVFVLSSVLALMYFVTRDTRFEMIEKRERLRAELYARGLVQIALLKLRILPQDFYNAYKLSTFNPDVPLEYMCVLDGMFFPYRAIEGVDYPSGLRSLPEVRDYLDNRGIDFGPIQYDAAGRFIYLGRRGYEGADPNSQVWANSGEADGDFIQQLRVQLRSNVNGEDNVAPAGAAAGLTAFNYGRLTWAPFDGEAFVTSMRLVSQVQENLRDAVEIEVFATVDTGIDMVAVGMKKSDGALGETMRESILHRELVDLRWRAR